MQRLSSISETEPNPLSSQDFRHKLFMYEDCWAAGQRNQPTYAFLLAAYQSLVAYYDKLADPTMDYFLNKMQNLLTQAAESLGEEASGGVSPKQPLETFEEHQQMKMKKLDFSLNLVRRKESEKQAKVKDLIENHVQATRNLEKYIASQAQAQAARFELKMEERRHRSVSRSLANWTFNSAPRPSAPPQSLLKHANNSIPFPLLNSINH